MVFRTAEGLRELRRKLLFLVRFFLQKMELPRASWALWLLLFPMLWAFARGAGEALRLRGEQRKGRGSPAETVSFPPSPVSISATGLPAVNGSDVTLTCTAEDDNVTVTYYWYRVDSNGTDGDFFFSGSGSGLDTNTGLKEIQMGQNLTFSPVLYDDNGVYACGAVFGDNMETLSDNFTLYGEH